MPANWILDGSLIAEHMRRLAELDAAGLTPPLPERIHYSPTLAPEQRAMLDAMERHQEATKNLHVGTY